MKKILFNDKFNLTEAVMSGRKTQTRRMIPIDLYNACDWSEETPMFEDCNGDWHPFYESKYVYKIGEVVAVAQSYRDMGYDANALDRDPKDISKVRGTLGESAGWNNKLFVRAEACKNRIRITNVRVERLNEISGTDCIAEGIVEWDATDYNQWEPTSDNITEYHIICSETKHLVFTTPREAYATLIDRISGRGTWLSNPWVFAYDFELVK